MRLLDRWLLDRERALLGRRDDTWRDAVVVDVGIGEEPWTTTELRDAVAPVPVVAVDVDPARVARAREHGVDARLASFAAIPEPARIVRAMNLVRAFDESEVDTAHRALARPLLDGGLVLEGTSDATGAVVTAWVIRKRDSAVTRERLLFLTDFSRGFGPGLFWDHLPRDLRRAAAPGTGIRAFLDRWTDAFADRAPRRTPADAFRASADAIAQPGDTVGDFFFEVRWPS